MSIKILTVVGARPQFIKAATVSRQIVQHEGIHEVIVHTGQHYDANMSDVFFEEMKIPKPTHTLGIGGGSHGSMTGRQLEKIEEVLISEKPDYVLVYGDTNSTLAGALAAAKLHIPVVHVEAGLRSFNMKMPEEINRILTDQVSSILFCPTATAIQNLDNEGFSHRDCFVHNVGDVMYDAAMFYAPSSVKPPKLVEVSDSFALVTIHRAENTDDLNRLKELVAALNELAKEIFVICPLHPRTQKIIKAAGIKLNAHVLEPVGYFEMIWLIQNCKVVLTDSGGLQKEAYFFKKPCVTLRDQTEWVELIDAGVNTLVEICKSSILEQTYRALNISNDLFSRNTIFGNGYAAEKIVQELLKS